MVTPRGRAGPLLNELSIASQGIDSQHWMVKEIKNYHNVHDGFFQLFPNIE